MNDENDRRQQPQGASLPAESLRTVDILGLTAGIQADWSNFVLAEVNDHVIRVSVLNRDVRVYVWNFCCTNVSKKSRPATAGRRPPPKRRRSPLQL